MIKVAVDAEHEIEDIAEWFRAQLGPYPLVKYDLVEVFAGNYRADARRAHDEAVRVWKTNLTRRIKQISRELKLRPKSMEVMDAAIHDDAYRRVCDAKPNGLDHCWLFEFDEAQSSLATMFKLAWG
jgi:hypothetical protein